MRAVSCLALILACVFGDHQEEELFERGSDCEGVARRAIVRFHCCRGKHPTLDGGAVGLGMYLNSVEEPQTCSYVLNVCLPEACFDKSAAWKLQGLNPTCMFLDDGWWTYRWCHRHSVTQFHKTFGGGAEKLVTMVGNDFVPFDFLFCSRFLQRVCTRASMEKRWNFRQCPRL
jgi:hypothetical protein